MSTRSRTPIILGVSLLVAAILGVGAFAATKFLGGGTPVARALPDSVVALAAIDMDPGAKQKVEAIRTLRKFPELRKQLEVNEKDDLRKKIFDEVVKSSPCRDEVSFGKDVEPWLGDSAAVGAADLGGEKPSPVLALQISDEDAAAKTVEKLIDCGDGGADDFSYGFNDDYLIISDGKDNAAKLAERAKKASLADAEEYSEWHDKAGGDGIVNFFVSKDAAELISETLPPEMAAQLGAAEQTLAQFKGMAGALRFADGGVELEMASSGGQDVISDGLGDTLSGLPQDTALALGFRAPQDYADKMVEQFGSLTGDSKQLIDMAETQTGLNLPEDLTTLLGESVVLALGGEAPANLNELAGPGDLPLGIKVTGDTDKIEAVVKKAEQRAGSSLASVGAVQRAEGDNFVLASSDDYAEAMLEKGSLGEQDAFTRVIPQGDDAAGALFVNFNSDWVDAIAQTVKDMGGATTLKENLKPLGALGISGWRDGDTSRLLVKLTTD